MPGFGRDEDRIARADHSMFAIEFYLARAAANLRETLKLARGSLRREVLSVTTAVKLMHRKRLMMYGTSRHRFPALCTLARQQ